jgi:hypothetical protein
MRSLSDVASSPRWLIVVADNQPVIAQGLRLTFANDPSVEVVVDRRGAEFHSPVSGGGATPERRLPLSPDQRVVWSGLKFFLVDRWKGMAVYETPEPDAPGSRP